MKKIIFLFSLLGNYFFIFTVNAQQPNVEVTTGGGSHIIYQKSSALLIQASTYRNANAWNPLPHVPLELEKVKAALKKQGFVVTELTDPTGAQLYPKINQFLSQAYDEKARAIVYYSGHGWTDKEGNGYLVGVDAPDPQDPSFRSSAISMEIIKSLGKISGARHTLFVFDSCYSGSIFAAKGNEELRPLVFEELEKRAVQFLSSGTASQRTPAISQFTPAFINGIEGRADLDDDKIVQARELALYLQKIVPQNSNQTPQFGSIEDTGGQMIFVPKLTPVALAEKQDDKERISQPSLPAPNSQNSQDQKSGKVNEVSASKKFSEMYPKTMVYYYRKSADGLKVLDVLNKSDIPFLARRAELPESYETDSVGCEPKHTDFNAVKTVALALIDSGFSIRSIYTMSDAYRKPGRIQLNSNRQYSSRPPLTRADVESLKECPKAFSR
jgi:uncharacterized caspase-like protein